MALTGMGFTGMGVAGPDSRDAGLAGFVGFLFQFFEGGVLFELLDVVGQIRLFLFDLFFFQSFGGGRRSFQMILDGGGPSFCRTAVSPDRLLSGFPAEY